MGEQNSAFSAFVVEQLAPLGSIACARFFGGLSLKSGGVLFAMIMDGTLYFAVDDLSRPEYERLGSSCFSYQTKNGRVDVRRFHAVPADVLDDADQLVSFARRALAAAAERAPRPRKAPARSRKPPAKRT